MSFVGTVHPEHGPGFDLWVGGGLSTNPMLAQKLGVWIPLDEVARRLGGRGLGLPRLRLPPAALARPAEVPRRRLGRGEVPRDPRERVPRPHASSTAPRPRSRRPAATTSACTRRRTASFYVGARPGRRPGRPARSLTALADLVEEYAAAGVRLTAHQKIVVLDVDAGPRRGAVADAVDAIGLTARPSNWRRDTMACTGIEFCKLAIVDTKDRGHRPDRRAGAAGSPTSTPRSPSTSTAAPTPAPAPRSPTSGSRASSCSTTTATRSRASRSTSAAASALDPRSAASSARTRSPASASTTTSPTWSRRYLADRDDGETFAAWVARADEEALRGERTLEAI